MRIVETEHHLGIGFVTPIACLAGLYLGRAWPICRLAAVATFIVWLATTYLPGDTFALLATGVSYYCAAGLFLDVREPAWRALGLAIVVCLLLADPISESLSRDAGARPRSSSAFWKSAAVRGHPRALIAPAIALAVIGLKLFNLELILHGIVIIGPVAALLARIYDRSRRWEVGLGSLALLLLFLIVITLLDQPPCLIGTLAVPAISLAVSAPRTISPAGLGAC